MTAVARKSIPFHLSIIATALILTMIPLLHGCGGGGETGSDPTVTVTPGGEGSTGPIGATASLAWNPVDDPSISPPVYVYFVHYGRQSPNQPGSCQYESSLTVNSPSATIANLDNNTMYYFAVSAYNGLESACSSEITLATPPPSA